MVRLATYHAELTRRGPGLLLGDILKGDPQVGAVAALVAAARPDILLLTGVDHDGAGHTLSALADVIGEAGPRYPHRFALRPNSGLRTGLDMDGDGRTGGARDAHGYGRFPGAGGLALLSRWPLGDVTDLSALLWRDVPGAVLPVHPGGEPFPSEEAQAIWRLSSTGHWIVPIRLPGPPERHLTILAYAATPPVFDGPEDANGLRSAAETGLWRSLLDGALDVPPPEPPFAILGRANLDPSRGDGRREAIRALLSDPRLKDPEPLGESGAPATADFTDPTPGDMRLDYVLPSADLGIRASGVLWPEAEGLDLVEAASRGRLVWTDVEVEPRAKR
ncbi:endonuclease/exonuclease/phosphatase family protein [Tropicimonas sp. IMCC34011]|uniref:endonuclease/exonuclease/phosphatase family protein n=1 Tax=Tropicimonas sp. IMCC34011 TaxID=2248759 RepID=UPI001E5F9885|nr:endonuclease/exonuclease/phosphatase family protein [Tropicimonas sp. IMCC34011]